VRKTADRSLPPPIFWFLITWFGIEISQLRILVTPWMVTQAHKPELKSQWPANRGRCAGLARGLDAFARAGGLHVLEGGVDAKCAPESPTACQWLGSADTYPFLPGTQASC
jgi:hypothetical protein